MISVAIVGTGNICPKHVNAYLTFPERCKIVALVDIYPEKAQKMAERFGLDCQIFDSHTKMLEACQVDLVDVCTPPYVHASISIDAMEHGCNVVCEKPMAASLEECDQVIACAQRTGKLFSSIAQNRFRTPIQRLKTLLDTGVAGDVKHVQVDSFWWRGHCYYDLWWRGTWEKEGGGCTLNHAVHHIDMLGWMMGMPNEVTAVLGNMSHDNAEVEDLSVAVMRYPSAMATVTSSVVHHGEKQQLIFQCADARISAPFEVFASRSRANGFPERNEQLEQKITEIYENIPEVVHIAHTGQIDNILTALETGAAPAVTGQDGRNTIELITGIYKAGTTGRAVTFPIAKDDVFYTVQGIMENVPHFYEKTVAAISLSDESITTGSDYHS